MRLLSNLHKTTLYIIWLLILFLSLNLILNQSAETQVWSDLAVGKYIASNLKIPQIDIFSFSTHEKPYIASNWFYQVILFLVYKFSGNAGLIILKMSIMGLICLLFFAISARRRWNLLIAGLFTSYFIFYYKELWILRTQLAGIIFFIVLWDLIIRFKSEFNKKHLYQIVPLMLLWANVDSSYIVGITILITVVFLEFAKKSAFAYFNIWMGNRLKWNNVFRFLNTVLLSVLATLINPYGYKMALHSLRNISMNILYCVAGWYVLEPVRMLDFYVIIIPAGVIALMFIVSVRNRDITDFAVLISLFALGYFVKKFSLYFFLYSFILAIKYFSAFYGKSIAGIPEFRKKQINAVLVCLVISLNLIFICAGNLFPLFYKQGADMDKFQYPSGAVEFISNNKFGPNIYSPFYYGGYMLYNLYPAYKNFIDYRTLSIDGEPVLDDMRLRLGEIEWKWFAEKYNLNGILMRYTPGLREVDDLEFVKYVGKLKYSPDWVLAYWDDDTVLYVKSSYTDNDKFYFGFDPQNKKLLFTDDPSQKREIKSELLMRASQYPPSAWCYLYLAVLSLRDGNFEEGKNYLDQACAVNPFDKRIILYRDMLQWDGSEINKLRDYSGANINNELQPVYALMAMGLYKSAIKFLGLTKETSDNSIEVNLLYALSYERTGQYASALSYFQKALNLDPDNMGVLYSLALCYKNHGIYDRATEIIKQALKKDQGNFVFWNLLAQVTYNMGNYEESLAFCNQALEIMPYNFDSWYLAGNIYYLLNRQDKALVAFERSLQLRPFSDKVKMKLAGICIDMGDYAKAEKIVGSLNDEFLKNDPEYNFLKSRLMVHHGDLKSAGDYLRNAIKFGNPGYIDRINRSDDLKNIIPEYDLKELIENNQL